MIDVRTRPELKEWLAGLRDLRAQARIAERVRRIALGNAGTTNSVGGGVQELKIDYGPGYRVYFIRRGVAVVILLCGGDKGTQGADIKRAKALAKEP